MTKETEALRQLVASWDALTRAKVDYALTISPAISAEREREIMKLGEAIHNHNVAIEVSRQALQAALAQPECARCKDLEEHAYDLLGQLKVANLKGSVAHPWVGLTDEEIDLAIGFVGSFGARQDARAIEAKLREKNT